MFGFNNSGAKNRSILSVLNSLLTIIIILINDRKLTYMINFLRGGLFCNAVWCKTIIPEVKLCFEFVAE